MDKGKAKVKSVVINTYIMPLLQPLLKQVQATVHHRIDNLGLAAFGNIIRDAWEYTGKQASLWTMDHIREVALMKRWILKMNPK